MSTITFRRVQGLRALVATLAVATCGTALALPVTAVVAVQGHLRTVGGGPVPDGKYSIKLKLYDGPGEQAAALFTDIFLAVSVALGQFAVELGAGESDVPMPADLFAIYAETWLGVAVAGEPELPRVRLGAVPYALQAGHAAVADLATNAAQAAQATNAAEAAHAGSADTAKQADKATLATTAETATQADNAAQASVALKLACTGCVTIDHLDEGALSASHHTAVYAGQVTDVQTAVTGMAGRLQGIEVGIQAKDGKVAVGGDACSVAVEAVCQQGRPAHLVVSVPDAVAMQALVGDGLVVHRQDVGKYYGRGAGGFWRAFRFEPYCGDGVVEAGEACDAGDKNADAPDACRPDCAKPMCGDQIVDTGEACDDANGDNTDICVASCKAASCGDGFVLTGVEACDDSNGSDNDICTNACEKNICGDGKLLTGVEECDDGNLGANDGCDAACKSEASAIGCADNTAEQTFSASMVGCNGAYTKANFETACAKGWHPANANEYATYGGATQVPNDTRWIDSAWDAAGKDISLKSWTGNYNCSNSAGWGGLCKNNDCTWVSYAAQACDLAFTTHDYGVLKGCHCRGGDPNSTGHGVVCSLDSKALPRL